VTNGVSLGLVDDETALLDVLAERRKAAHTRRVTEMKDTPLGVEGIDHLGEVTERSRQAVDLVDDDGVDPAGPYALIGGRRRACRSKVPPEAPP
jgi:hypothetical protein